MYYIMYYSKMNVSYLLQLETENDMVRAAMEQSVQNVTACEARPGDKVCGFMYIL